MENQGKKNAVGRLNNLLRVWFYSSHKEQEKQPSNELKHIPWPGWKEIGEIGEGSFGAVYKIKHSLINGEEYAALKVISVPRNKSNIKSMRADGMDDESITKRIKDEAENVLNEYEKLLALQGTPNIVHCKMVHCEQHSDAKGYDIYILMELLTPFLDRVNELKGAEKQIIRFGSEMCNALVACENKGILHRDIKPENVFVSKDGTYKLGDFGVARSMDHTTYATQGVGTPSYMAPEVANGKDYNKQADIYSLGIMLYWLLNEGRIPFLPLPPEPVTPTNRQTALDRRRDGEQIPAPKNGSEELQSIVLKACAFDPKDRYQSAREMQKDLSRLCGGDFLEDRITGGGTVGPVFESQCKGCGHKNAASSTHCAKCGVSLDESDDGGTVGPDFGTQCKKCGHKNAAGSTHCSKCGASLDEADDGGTVGPDFGTQCKKCGHKNATGSTHCAKCGTSLIDGIQCKKCGHKNSIGSTHCSKCGASLKGDKKTRKRILIATLCVVLIIVFISWYLSPRWSHRNGNNYYLVFGEKTTGWQYIGEDRYYFDEDGAMCTGWRFIDGEKYYLGLDGATREGWHTIDGEKYYFSVLGYAYTDWWYVDENKYYFGSDGIMRTGWQTIDGERYYLGLDGAVRTEWQTIDGKQYYFDFTGIMSTGWEYIDGERYWFFNNGVMATGWLQNTDGYWWYFGSDGKMRTGWQSINGQDWYFGDNGILQQ